MALLGRDIVGSWTEGGYEVEFAVTPAMIAALKPAYRGWFGQPGQELR